MELSYTLLYSAILPGTAFWRMENKATYIYNGCWLMPASWMVFEKTFYIFSLENTPKCQFSATRFCSTLAPHAFCGVFVCVCLCVSVLATCAYAYGHAHHGHLSSKTSWGYCLIGLYCKYTNSFLLAYWPGEVWGWQPHDSDFINICVAAFLPWLLAP